MSGSCICRCTIMTSAGYYPLGWLQRLPRVIMFRWLSQLGNGAGGQIGTRRSWSGLAGIGATTTALVMRKWQRKRTNQEPLTYGHKPQEWVEWGVLGSGSLRAFCYLLSGKKGVKGTRGETNGRPRGKMQLRCCSQNSSQHQPIHTHTPTNKQADLEAAPFCYARRFTLPARQDDSFVLRPAPCCHTPGHLIKCHFSCNADANANAVVVALSNHEVIHGALSILSWLWQRMASWCWGVCGVFGGAGVGVLKFPLILFYHTCSPGILDRTKASRNSGRHPSWMGDSESPAALALSLSWAHAKVVLSRLCTVKI